MCLVIMSTVQFPSYAILFNLSAPEDVAVVIYTEYAVELFTLTFDFQHTFSNCLHISSDKLVSGVLWDMCVYNVIIIYAIMHVHVYKNKRSAFGSLKTWLSENNDTANKPLYVLVFSWSLKIFQVAILCHSCNHSPRGPTCGSKYLERERDLPIRCWK